jgi:hypothetical protein
VRLAWFYRGIAKIINENTVKITSDSGTCRITINSEIPIELSLDSYSEEGFMDRNNVPLPPEDYPFIKITSISSDKHHLKTTFHFS